MMSKISQRARPTPKTRLALVVGAFAAVVVAAYGSIAQAATANPSAQDSADQLTSILIDYGPVLGGMYVAFLVARSVVARYKDVHGLAGWLSQGKRLAYTTSALGVAYAALSAALNGGSIRVIFAAAAAAAFKLITPTTPDDQTSGDGTTAITTTIEPKVSPASPTTPTPPKPPTPSAA